MRTAAPHPPLHAIEAHPPFTPWRELLLTRLPVLDMKQQTTSYELQSLASPDDAPASPSIHMDQPDAQQVRQNIHHALHTIGLDSLLGRAGLMLPVAPENLHAQDYLLLPPHRTQLLMHLPADPCADLIQACADAAAAGYPLAISLSPHAHAPRIIDITHPLLNIASVVRMTLPDTSDHTLPHAIDALRHPRRQWLATGVNERAQFDTARRLGFDLVQGHFFCEPAAVAGRELSTVQAVKLQFLTQLNKPKLDFDLLEQIIKSDVALTCQLLRHMNCAAMGLKQKIASVKQAMVLLGERPMRQWGALVAVSCLGKDQPHALLVTSLVRARFCERLAQQCGMHEQSLDLFLTGLLSTLDALLDTPMEQLLQKMPVNPQVRCVLRGDHASDQGRIYAMTLAAERGRWASVTELAQSLHLTHHQIAMLYYQTLQWTQQIFTGAQAA